MAIYALFKFCMYYWLALNLGLEGTEPALGNQGDKVCNVLYGIVLVV